MNLDLPLISERGGAARNPCDTERGNNSLINRLGWFCSQSNSMAKNANAGSPMTADLRHRLFSYDPILNLSVTQMAYINVPNWFTHNAQKSPDSSRSPDSSVAAEARRRETTRWRGRFVCHTHSISVKAAPKQQPNAGLATRLDAVPVNTLSFADFILLCKYSCLVNYQQRTKTFKAALKLFC